HHVIEVGHFLIAVIDRRAAETGLPVTRRAGTREEIAAVVEFDVENIQRHWIDVRSVTRDVRTTKRIEVSLAGMIRRTVRRSKRSPETGGPPVAVGNWRQKGCGKTLRANSVFLPSSL